MSGVWGRPMRSVACVACSASFRIAESVEIRHCPDCHGAFGPEESEVVRAEAPERVVPFEIDEAELRRRLERWVRPTPFRSPGMQAGALVRNATRTWLPVWLVDATVDARWQAELGYDYQVASAREELRGGHWTTHKVTETRIRWEPRAGILRRRYENRAAPALEEHSRWMAQLGSFDEQRETGYQAGHLDRSVARAPERSPADAWPGTVEQFERAVTDEIRRACRAQHVRAVALDAKYDRLHWTQRLLPVYSTFYRTAEGKPVPVRINGQSGRIHGRRIASTARAWRWTASLAAAAIVAYLLAGLLGRLGIGTGPLPLLWLGLGALAPWPVIRASRFNARRG